MISNLPEWYRIAAIDNISEGTLEKRSLAIDEMMNNDEAFLLNCVRMFLGKKVTNNEFDQQFFTVFHSKDGLYLKDTGLLEKRVLSGAIIAQMFDGNDLSNKLAYALVCGSFGISDTNLINKDIIANAQEYLDRRAESERRSTPFAGEAPTFKDKMPSTDLEASGKAVVTYVRNMANYMEKQLRHSQKRIDQLQEESDIHWWLFRSYSNLRLTSVAKLPSEQAAFILAHELSKLMTIIPAPKNTASFLDKSLKEVTDLPDEFSIKQTAEILGGLNAELENVLDGNKYGNLTPLIFAMGQRAETEENEAWTVLFTQSAKLDVDFRYSAQKIGLQFFNELMLLSIQ